MRLIGRKGTQRARQHDSVNKHVKRIILDFFEFSSQEEIRHDIVLPCVISLIIFALLAFFTSSNTSILDTIKKINAVSLSVMAILAGFNTTSLSIIAATNKDALKKLFASGSSSNGNILKQVVTFFSFAILIQVFILIIGTILVIGLGALPGIYQELTFFTPLSATIGLAIFGFIWTTVILYSLVVSARNISVLYRYIMYVGKNSEEDSESK